MRSSNVKALSAKQFGDSREEGNTNNSNHDQEEEKMMTSIVSRNPRNVEPFNTEIRVGNKTVFASDDLVWVHAEIGALSFTPEQACAFAAALSAVGVHVMEEASEVAA